MAKRNRRQARGVVNRKRHKGTHAERMAYARQLWEQDPSLPHGTDRGVAALVEARFGLVPSRQQLMELHAEINAEQRANAKRARIIREEKERRERAVQPVLSPAKATQLRLVPDTPAEREPREQMDAAKASKEPSMGIKSRSADPQLHPLHAKRNVMNGPNGKSLYADAYRAKVVAHVESRPASKSIQDVLAELGLYEATYYKWRRDAVASASDGKLKPTPRQIASARKRIAVYEDRQRTGDSFSVLAARHKLGGATVHRYGSDEASYAAAKEMLRLVGEPQPEPQPAPQPEPPPDPAQALGKFAPPPLVQSARTKPTSSSARDAIEAAMRMLYDEVPGLVSVEFKVTDGKPSLQYEVAVVEKEKVEW